MTLQRCNAEGQKPYRSASLSRSGRIQGYRDGKGRIGLVICRRPEKAILLYARSPIWRVRFVVIDLRCRKQAAVCKRPISRSIRRLEEAARRLFRSGAGFLSARFLDGCDGISRAYYSLPACDRAAWLALAFCYGYVLSLIAGRYMISVR